MDVAVIGATGYGGIELIRLLSMHKNIDNIHAYSTKQDGEAVETVYPHMKRIFVEKYKKIDLDEIKQQCSVVFLATPHGVSRDLGIQCLEKGISVIDLSGDFRLHSEEVHENWYGQRRKPIVGKHTIVYGLTEWNRRQVKEADLISNPGCFPTAVLLGLVPLLQHCTPTGTIIIDGKTGITGAGRGLSLRTHFSEISESVSAYRIHEHQHTPEMEQEARRQNEQTPNILFTPHLVPMLRGILTTIHVPVAENWTESALYKLYEEAYKDEWFVRLLPYGQFPATKEVKGSNFCDIGIRFDSRTNVITIVSVIDNLVKGAAGQAIQNMNVRFAFDEREGLHYAPLYP